MQMKNYIIAIIVLFCVSCGNKQNVSESDTTEIDTIPYLEKIGIDSADISIYENEIKLVFSSDMDIYYTPNEYFDSLFMTNKDSLLTLYGYEIPELYNEGANSVSGREAEKDIFRMYSIDYYMDYSQTYAMYDICLSCLFSEKAYLKLIHKYYNRLLLKVSDSQKKILIESQKTWLQSHKLDNDFADSIYQPYDYGDIYTVSNNCAVLEKCKARFYFILGILVDYEEMNEE